MKSLQHLKKDISLAPRRPGIYQFYFGKEVIYVGKALSLKDRLSSYLSADVTSKTEKMLSLATSVAWIETGSEFEALLLEANLIKKYRPTYNVIFKDDKSYLYIFISLGENFPKIFMTRRPDLFKELKHKTEEMYEGLKGVYFGPYASARSARDVLKHLRRIFPFCQQKSIGKRPCFYSHIHLCNPCPSFIVKQDIEKQKELKKIYRAHIFSIKHILEGKLPDVLTDVEKQMEKAAKEEKFEEASQIRNQLFKLRALVEPRLHTRSFLENPNFYFEEQERSTQELYHLLKPYFPKLTDLKRIECYDISNLQGTNSVGAQVTFINGIPEKNEYRLYRIRLAKAPNDFAMLSEMLKRRLAHTAWGRPDLLIIDGGKPQVGTIARVLAELGETIPHIGLAKRLEEIILLHDNSFTTIRLSRKNRALQLLQQIRDETHRFAITYHRKKRTEEFAKLNIV